MPQEILDWENHYSVITSRELKILRLKGQGQDHETISNTLGIKKSTLKNLLCSRREVSDTCQSGVYEKLGLSSKNQADPKDLSGGKGTAAVMRAIAFGLLKVEDFGPN